MKSNEFNIEHLSNGFILLTDRSCQWDVMFNADGSYHSGGVNSPDYALAVKTYLSKGGAK